MIGSNGHRLQGRLDPTQLKGIPPMRPLPVAIRLVRGETHHSLARRLAEANHLTEWELFGAIPRHQAHDPQNLQGLAQLTGRPCRLLQRVVTPPGKNPFTMPVSACSRCLARRGITTAVDITVPIWNPICHQHQRWLSRGHHGAAEFDIQILPEVTRAQRRLAQAFVIPGGRRALQGWETAQHVLHRWTERGDWPIHRRRRLSHYIDTDSTLLNPQHPLAELVNFPEAVALARIINNPYWMTQATHDTSSLQQFHTEVRRRLDIDYEPYDEWDPLRIWRQRNARRAPP